MSDFFVHETSYGDEGCEIGAGTKIWHFSHVMPNCKISKNCNIGQNVVSCPNVELRKNVKIQNNVTLFTGVVCEDDVFLSPGVLFTNIDIPRSHISKMSQSETLVKKGCSVGAQSTIIGGNTLGDTVLLEPNRMLRNG